MIEKYLKNPCTFINYVKSFFKNTGFYFGDDWTNTFF